MAQVRALVRERMLEELLAGKVLEIDDAQNLSHN
jgi:hypothetical protein